MRLAMPASSSASQAGSTTRASPALTMIVEVVEYLLEVAT
jgi:hypothetical protein